VEKIELVFATNNQNKVNEIRSILKEPFHIITLKDAGIDIDIPEPHDTLEANASEKSSTIHRITHKNCFSEDTGLEVLFLNGEPGVKSARYEQLNSELLFRLFGMIRNIYSLEFVKGALLNNKRV
jgi:non-canonical purine NTP pyrophosphatase (RdgB/HAM1 family)